LERCPMRYVRCGVVSSRLPITLTNIAV